MYKLLTSKGQLLAIIIGLLSTLIAIGSIVSGVTSKYSMSEDLNAVLKNDQINESFDFFNPAVYVIVGLIIAALVLAVVFGLIGLLSDPKGSLKFLLGLAALAVLFFALYSSSDAVATGRLAELTPALWPI